MLDLVTFPNPASFLASVGAWADPIFSDLLPFAYFALGVIAAIFFIIFIINVLSKLLHRHSDWYAGYVQHSKPSQLFCNHWAVEWFDVLWTSANGCCCNWNHCWGVGYCVYRQSCSRSYCSLRSPWRRPLLNMVFGLNKIKRRRVGYPFFRRFANKGPFGSPSPFTRADLRNVRKSGHGFVDVMGNRFSSRFLAAQSNRDISDYGF